MGWLNAVTGQALVIAGMGLAAGAAPAHQAPLASALLSAVEGTDGAACHLILSALENRWGGSSVRPKMMLGGLADPRAGEVATWAQRGEPGSLDVDELMAGLTASDPCVQGVAARLLGRVDDASTSRRLMAIARDRRSSGRRASLMALGFAGRTDAVPVLVDALGDTEPDVRYVAAVALGRTESSGAIPALIAALDSEQDVDVRTAVAWALGRIE